MAATLEQAKAWLKLNRFPFYVVERAGLRRFSYRPDPKSEGPADTETAYGQVQLAAFMSMAEDVAYNLIGREKENSTPAFFDFVKGEQAAAAAISGTESATIAGLQAEILKLKKRRPRKIKRAETAFDRLAGLAEQHAEKFIQSFISPAAPAPAVAGPPNTNRTMPPQNPQQQNSNAEQENPAEQKMITDLADIQAALGEELFLSSLDKMAKSARADAAGLKFKISFL
ncbi:MAG: hypothetical protein V4543_08430 [Bacteroidota bacterium]